MPAPNHKSESAKPRLPKLDARLIPTAKIIPPHNPARLTMDEVKLQELIDSIAAVGLIEPLVVEPEGDVFRILAGHRRFIACSALAMPNIPCIVRAVGEIDGEAITSHENSFREDLNPAEEAKYFQELLESKCGGDTDQLAARVRHTRSYVEGRLLLFAGDPRVLEAFGAGTIQLGVAHELNKVADSGMRLVYLDACLKGGASVSLVRQWRMQSNAQYGENLPTPPDQAPAGVVALPAPVLTLSCFFCGSQEDVYAMELLYLHRHCRRAIDSVVSQRLNPAE